MSDVVQKVASHGVVTWGGHLGSLRRTVRVYAARLIRCPQHLYLRIIEVCRNVICNPLRIWIAIRVWGRCAAGYWRRDAFTYTNRVEHH